MLGKISTKKSISHHTIFGLQKKRISGLRLHPVRSINNKSEVEYAEQKASRSAMVGFVAACIGEIYFDGHPGITHQLALECHTTSFIAYFLIVFTAAFDVEKMTRYLDHAFQFESYQKKRSASLLESAELVCGRMAMILFVYFFLNGIHNHGFAHEVGPVQQMAEFFRSFEEQKF